MQTHGDYHLKKMNLVEKICIPRGISHHPAIVMSFDKNKKIFTESSRNKIIIESLLPLDIPWSMAIDHYGFSQKSLLRSIKAYSLCTERQKYVDILTKA